MGLGIYWNLRGWGTSQVLWGRGNLAESEGMGGTQPGTEGDERIYGIRGDRAPRQILRGCEDLVGSRRAGITQLGAEGVGEP